MRVSSAKIAVDDMTIDTVGTIDYSDMDMYEMPEETLGLSSHVILYIVIGVCVVVGVVLGIILGKKAAYK